MGDNDETRDLRKGRSRESKAFARKVSQTMEAATKKSADDTGSFRVGADMSLEEYDRQLLAHASTAHHAEKHALMKERDDAQRMLKTAQDENKVLREELRRMRGGR